MEKTKHRVTTFLLWLEKYTKTDMVYLASGGFWTIISQIIVTISTLLLAIAFAHFVSKETYGEYKFILSIATILGVFTLTGFGAAVFQSVSQGFEGTLRYAFWKNIKWSVLFFILALGTSIYYFANDNQSFGIAMLIIGGLSPIWSSTNLYDSYLSAKKDFRRSAIYFGIIGNLFPAACIFVTILLTSKPLWLIFVYFTSNTLIGLILYIKVFRIYKPNKMVDTKALGYSKHLSFMRILGGISSNIDQILVFHYVGATELAIYNFAIAIPQQIKGPLKGLAGLIFPKYTEREDNDIRRGMKNKIILLFIASIVIIGTYILVAPYIFHVFFPKYTDSIFYSQIFSLSFFWIVSIPASTYLLAKKKIKEQYIGSTTSSIIQTIFLFIGVIWGGLFGLVIARVTTSLVLSFVSIILFERASRRDVSVI